MKFLFPLLAFSFIFTFSSSQTIMNFNSYEENSRNLNSGKSKFRDTISSRIQYLDINLLDLPIRNLNLNYERSIKTKNSIEVGGGLKLPYRLANGKIPVIPISVDNYNPLALEYIVSKGYNLNLNYKRNISRKNFKTYIGIGCFYRYYSFKNKLEDLSFDGTDHGAHLFWESVSQQIAGVNLFLGYRIFVGKIFFLDFFSAAGIKKDFRYENLTQDYTFSTMHYYDPPREFYRKSIHPNFQVGIKAGFFKKK